MLKSEYEAMTNTRVTYDVYHRVIEPMYLAIPEYIDKREFIRLINPKMIEKLNEEVPDDK